MSKHYWALIAFIVPNSVFLYVNSYLLECSDKVNELVKSSFNILNEMNQENSCFSSLLVAVWIAFLPVLYFWWYRYFLSFKPPLLHVSKLKAVLSVLALYLLFLLVLQIDLDFASRRNRGLVTTLVNEKYAFLLFFSLPFCFLSMASGRVIYYLRKGV